MVIGSEEQLLFGGSLANYDLDWWVDGNELPLAHSKMRFRVNGLHARRLASGDCDGFQEGPIQLLLTCYSDAAGSNEALREDARWQLNLKTDPLSDLAIIDDEVARLAVWCRACRAEIYVRSYTCRVCVNYSLCHICYVKRGIDGHDRTHDFATQQVDLANDLSARQAEQPGLDADMDQEDEWNEDDDQPEDSIEEPEEDSDSWPEADLDYGPYEESDDELGEGSDDEPEGLSEEEPEEEPEDDPSDGSYGDGSGY